MTNLLRSSLRVAASRFGCLFSTPAFSLRMVRFRWVGIALLGQCLGAVGWAAKTPVTATLTVSAGSSPVTTVAAKTVVTLTAAVAGGGPGGQVTFCDATAPSCLDIHLLGIAAVTKLGTATMKFVPGIGVHSYKAVYLGTAQNAGAATGVVKLTVTGSYGTKTTLAQSGSVGNYGLTATVVGSGPGAPTGPVSFVDGSNGNALLGTAALGVGTVGLSLANSANPMVGSSPYAIQSADLNGDGIPDLVTANDGILGVTVLLGNGDGTFTQKTGTAFPSSTYFLVIADLDGDGVPDLVTASPFGGGVDVLLGNGDGTFRASQNIPDRAYPFALATGDFNGDGVPDLAIGQSNNSAITIMLGAGDGTFGSPISVGPNMAVWSMVTGDFNGDGLVDLIGTIGNDVLIFLGKGDGTFTTTTLGGLRVSSNTALAVADFNQDGIPDLALTDYTGAQIALGKGDGTFTISGRAYSGQSFFSAGTVGDFNGDGIADIAASDPSNDIVVALGNGDGTFASTHFAQTTDYSNFIVAADFDGDGVSDLAVPNDYTNTVAALVTLRSVTATASVAGVSPLGSGLHTVKASYGGDGSYSGSVSGPVSLSAAQAATALTLSAAPAGGSSYGQQVALTAMLTPFAGQGDTTNGEAVTFRNGAGVVGMGALNNGVATLNLTTLPVGVDNLTAIYTGDVNFKGSDSGGPLSYAVAGLAPQISFAVANQTYGVAPFAVSAMSNSPGAITYSVVSGPATIAGNVVTLTGGGTVVLLASQAAAGNYAAGSQTATFTVSAPQTSVTLRLLSDKLVYPLPTIFEVEIGLRGNTRPTGLVQLVDGNAVVGTYPVLAFLDGYVLGLTPQLAVGQHTLVARYLGDKNYPSGVSAAVILTVSAAGRR